MPVKQTQSGLMKKYGSKLNKAVGEVKDNETNYGIMNLPPGIKNGIAQLKKAYFKEYESGDYKGEFFFRAEGTCIVPKSITVDGVETQCAGLFTSFQEAVCDTKNGKGETTTFQEHVDNVLNAMRMLGADTSEATGENLEAIAASLQEAKPYFKFSTSAGKPSKDYPDPRTWENWHGAKGLEEFVPPDDDEVEDNTEAETDENAGDDSNGGSDTASEAGDWEEELQAALDKANGPENDFDDLLALGIAAGKTKKQCSDAEKWEDVAEWIRESHGVEASDESADPEKGNTYKYRPPKAKSDVEVEVDTVDKKAETVDCHNTENKKVKYTKVPWSSLKVE